MDKQLEECRDCGLMVANQAKHRRWHDQLKNEIAKLQFSMRALEKRIRP